MPKKILIVDDDLDGLKLISLMLQRHGYEVITANAGNQAIVIANNELPDLVILDVMMPDMNGYEVCRRLRANPTTQPIPIIMFTAKTMIDDKVAGFEAGADDYLTKPTHPAELASRVKAVLQRSNSQKVKTIDRGMTIGVLGVKGGIGTTTTVFNLGAAFKHLGENPIVADFQMGQGGLGLMMGLNRSTGMTNTLKRPVEEITNALLGQEIITHKSGLRALLCANKPKEHTMPFPLEAQARVIQGIRAIGRPSIFDLGSGYSRTISHIHTKLDRLILLIEPTSIALWMATELLQEMSDAVRPRISVVVFNRNFNNLNLPWHKIEQTLSYEIRAIISAAPELAFQAAESGSAMVNLQPNAVISDQFIKLAEYLNTVSQMAN